MKSHEERFFQVNLDLFHVLHEVVDICASQKFTYWVVGGLALDAKHGTFTRKHGDIDLCLLEGELQMVMRAFFKKDFRITRQGLKYVFYKRNYKIDVFPLVERGSFYERKREWFTAKYPRAMFENVQLVDFYDLQLRIPSNEGLRYYASKSIHVADQKYAETLSVHQEIYAKIVYHEFADYRTSIKNVKIEELSY